MAAVEAHPEGVLIRLRLQPRASRAELAGEANGRLRLRVTAAPVEGAANEAAVQFLAKALGVAKSSIELTRGRKSREKDFLVRGVKVEQAVERLRGR